MFGGNQKRDSRKKKKFDYNSCVVKYFIFVIFTIDKNRFFYDVYSNGL